MNHLCILVIILPVWTVANNNNNNNNNNNKHHLPPQKKKQKNKQTNKQQQQQTKTFYCNDSKITEVEKIVYQKLLMHM